MKTIRQHLESLPELYRDIAIYECERLGAEVLDEKYPTLHDAISCMFVWSKSKVGDDFWAYLSLWIKMNYTEPIRVHKKEKTAASQAILDEHRAHFAAQVKAILILMLNGTIVDKKTRLKGAPIGNVSSRISDICSNGIPVVKTKKLNANGKIQYMQYHIAPEHRADIAKRFKLKV